MNQKMHRNEESLTSQIAALELTEILGPLATEKKIRKEYKEVKSGNLP